MYGLKVGQRLGIRTFIAGLVLAVVACSASEKPSPLQPDIVIENVTVIDAIDGDRENMDVFIIADTIVDVKAHDVSRRFNDAKIIDGAGKYLIPGLWDAHVHLTYYEEIDYKTFFALSIAHGVTSLRDTGGHLTKLQPAQEAAAADPLSPDIYISGPLIDGPLRVYAGQTPFNPDISVGVSSPEEAEDMVDSLADAGVNFVKAYEMLSERTFEALVRRAHEKGLSVAAHVPLSMTASDAARVGADDMQHLRNLELACADNALLLRADRRRMISENDAPHPAALRGNIHRSQRASAIASLNEDSCDDLISVLAETGAAQTPTLMITRIRTHAAYADKTYRASFDFLPNEIGERWKTQSQRLMIPSTDETVLAYDAWVQSMLPRLAEAGVSILAGTDAPIGFLTPGASLHYELFLLVAAGLTPLQALEAATLAPAAFFGLENKIGTIAPGMTADLVLLTHSPLRDIRNVGSVEAVIKDGRLIDRDHLDDMLNANVN